MLFVDTIFQMAYSKWRSLLLLQIGLFWQNKLCIYNSMGENAFHMVFQERWVFSHSPANPDLAATRLWAYGLSKFFDVVLRQNHWTFHPQYVLSI